ncbi:hypothetical protein NPIL_207381 [Nephila pilipes]|uniref:Uncharacterized protein n=1 Tax=Nephila pilipes TaxID=299642 RepID=A0A8X6UPZ0_NEPPI|nr:hypothetical protein NPIL_207381 [Nephila pilipes]
MMEFPFSALFTGRASPDFLEGRKKVSMRFGLIQMTTPTSLWNLQSPKFQLNPYHLGIDKRQDIDKHLVT